MRESERLIVMDQLLSSKKSVSLKEFQKVFKVSAATVKRDMQKLRAVSYVPIVYSRALGAYHFDRENKPSKPKARHPRFSKTRTWFNEEELQMLVSAIGSSQRFSGDVESVSSEGFGILTTHIRTLFGLTSAKESELLSHIKVIGSARAGKDSPLFPLIGSALCEHRRLQTAYEPAQGMREFLELSPLRLVCKDGCWYLDVFSYETNEYRTLLVSAITHAEFLSGQGLVLTSDELEKKFANRYASREKNETKTAVLTFDKESTPAAALEVLHPKQKSRLEKQCLTVTVPYGEESELLAQLIRWGRHVEIQSPEELRRNVRTTLEQILSLYR